jgi:hypothetical protein
MQTQDEFDRKISKLSQEINTKERRPYSLFLTISAFVSSIPFVGLLIQTLIESFANSLLPLALSAIVPIALFIASGIVKNTIIDDRNIYYIGSQEITGENRKNLITLMRQVNVDNSLRKLKLPSIYNDLSKLPNDGSNVLIENRLGEALGKLSEFVTPFLPKVDGITSDNLTNTDAPQDPPEGLAKNLSEPGSERD